MPRPADDPWEIERRFFDITGARRAIRVATRAIIVLDVHILLQRMAMPDSYHFFPGGEVEFGEALETGLLRELAEETTLEIQSVIYRFTANNRFERNGVAFHLLEHYFEVTPTTFEVESREPGFLLDWFPMEHIHTLDIRPFGVRDILGVSGWRTIRLLEVE